MKQFGFYFLYGGLVALLLWPVLGFAASTKPTHPAYTDSPMVLKATISEVKNLPPAMYGTWSILATVLRSDAPSSLFSPSSTEIWLLSNDHGVITLSNVTTNASASITVDQVSGNTATFHHDFNARDMKVLETPTITVNGNHLNGINRQELSFYERGKLMAQYHLEIRVEGTRLAGAKVTFGDPDVPMDFEVAPLQFKR